MMIVEIQDSLIWGIVIAFLVGLVGLYGYFKLRTFVETRSKTADAAQSELLEYYEKELIDMKIRLDAIEMERNEGSSTEKRQFTEKPAQKPADTAAPKAPEVVVPEAAAPAVKQVVADKAPKVVATSVNPVDHVLQLITNTAMTSRDIQITLKKSREHTSRLLKRLYEEGYVHRNTESRPYTYSISEKGKAKISNITKSSENPRSVK